MAQRLEDNMPELLRSLEHLAMQRQLPLRQHRERRVLKPGGGGGGSGSGASRSIGGPVLLYNPLVPWDSSAAGGSGNVAEPQYPFAGFESAAAAAGQHSAAAAGGLAPSPGLRTYSYVQNGDPYSRPLSAKDLMTAGAVERAPSRTGAAAEYQHTGAAAHPYHAAQPALAHNAFIHPRSSSSTAAGAADGPAAQASQPSRQQQTSRAATPSLTVAPVPIAPAAIAIAKGSGAAASSQGSGSPSALSGTAAAKEKFEATLLKSAESAGAVRAASARPPTAIVRPLSAVRNPNYTPNRPATGSSGPTSPAGAACQAEGYDAGSRVSAVEAASSPPAAGKQSIGASDEVTVATAAASVPVAAAALAAAGTQHGQSLGTGDGGTISSSGSGAGSGGGSTAGAVSYYRISSKPESKVLQPAHAAGDGVAASTQAFKSLQLGKKVTSSENKPAPRRKLASRSTSHGSSQNLSDGEAEEDDDGAYGSTSLSDRTPGDGEAFDDEDDGIDCLDDDDVEGSDDDDDEQPASAGSVRSRAASASAAGRRRGPALQIRMKSASLAGQQPYEADEYRSPALGGGGQVQPALIKSLFSNVPPYINFVSEDERVELLPWEFRRLLRWRMCSITPNIVKKTIERSGFRTTKKYYDWLGCWGKHMKAAGFKSVREYQKLNHFPGSFQIGRKDRLWKNLLKMQVQCGKKEYGFFPQTYVLPADIKQLQRAWEDCGSKQKWIVKPPASARGIGIKVISKWNQIPKRRPVIVQKYLCRPYLINESKFDLRIYVYVPSYDPLRIYVYDDGLVRFASSKYSHSMKSISNKYMHLTNFSVNKKNTEYQSNSDDNVCQGHKWSLKSLWGYLQKKGVNTATLWKNIKDIIVKTIISSEAAVNSCIKANVRSRYSVHELFGFDILLDEELKPWVLEVNISPSLHSSSQLDINIKGAMIKDLHNMAAFRIPDKNDVVPNPGADSYKYGPPSNPYCMDKRLYTSSLTADEKSKHAYYCQRYNDESEIGSITDLLTPDDLRILIESVDEDCHKGSFQRVFPTSSSHVYLKFFEAPRYYNLLLDQWCQQFNRCESKGVAIIEMGCLRGVHLQNPTYDPLYQWCPPSSRTLTAASQMSALLLGASNGQLPTLRKKTSVDSQVMASAALVSRPPISPPRKPSVASS